MYPSAQRMHMHEQTESESDKSGSARSMRSFFPRVRTPCGRSAQIIIEGEGKRNMMRGKEHKQPQNQTKPTKPKQGPKTKKPPRPETDSPSSKRVSSVRGRDKCKKAKADCYLTMGLNSLRKSVGMVSTRAECSGAYQGAPHPQNCDQEDHCIEWRK